MAASAGVTPSVAAAASGKRLATAGPLRASPCFLLLLALALAAMAAAPSRAAVYMVGGSAGWTISEDVNYTAWAASKTFLVGDTIVFQYDKKLHNVVEVSRAAAYRRCSLQSALATHSTGNDSVVLDGAGHRYFLCAFHCPLGQKLHVRVRSPAARAPAPAALPAPPSPSPSPAAAAGAAPPRSSHRAAGRAANASTGATAPAQRTSAASPGDTAWVAVLLAVAAGAALGKMIAC